MPVIDDKKDPHQVPISYDPERDKYITEEDLIGRREEYISIESLSEDDVKKLTIARLKIMHEDDTAIQMGPISGEFFTIEELIEAIMKDEPDGMAFVEATKSVIRDRIRVISQLMK